MLGKDDLNKGSGPDRDKAAPGHHPAVGTQTMNKIIATTMVCFFLTATATLAAGSLILTDKSYGPVTFGNKLTEIEKRVGEKAKSETGEKGCDFITFKKFPGIMFMVEDGIVTRADAISPKVRNELDIQVGMPLEEVKRRYPQVEIKRHQYDPNGHYLIFKSKDGKRAIVFEEGDGKITDTRAGTEPSVEYVEGCL